MVGDKVMLFVGDRLGKISEKKLCAHWRPGYNIVEIKNNGLTVILTHDDDDPSKNKTYRYHVTKLRHYNDRRDFRISLAGNIMSDEPNEIEIAEEEEEADRERV